MRCRQLEKILFPPELAILLAELGQFSPFLAGELTLLGRAKVTPINPGLPDPLGQAADGQSQPLGHTSTNSASCSTSHATTGAKSACVTSIRLRDDASAEACIKAPRRRGCAGDKMQI